MNRTIIRFVLCFWCLSLLVRQLAAQVPGRSREQILMAEDGFHKMKLPSLDPPGRLQTSFFSSDSTPQLSSFYSLVSDNLRAETTNCPDSSFVKELDAGGIRHTYLCSARTADGGLLLGGFGRIVNQGPIPPYSSLLTKMDSLGNHIWSRQISSDVRSDFYIEGIQELSDGSIIISGWHGNNLYQNPPAEYSDFFVAKLTGTGDLTWIKTFHHTMNNNCGGSNIRFASVAEGTNGELLLSATIWNCSLPKYLMVFKLSNTGNMLWQYAYLDPGQDCYGAGIFYDAGEVTVINKANSGQVVHVDFLKLDYNTGTLISHKGWKADHVTPFNYSFTNRINVIRLQNGNFCVYGNTFGGYNPNPSIQTPRFAVAEFDTQYEFVNGYTIVTPGLGNPDVDRIKVNKDKRVLFSIFNNNIPYPSVDIYLGSIVSDRIVHERKREFRSTSVFYTNMELFGNGSYAYINNLATTDQSRFWLEYSLLHNSDTSGACLGIKTAIASIQSLPFVPFQFNWQSISNNPAYPTNNQLNSSVPFQYNPAATCYQTATCDTIKIHGIASSCNFPQQFTFTAFTNRACGTRVNWGLSEAILANSQTINDTTLLITFNQEWQGWLYATLPTSCGLLKDSVLITIQPSPGLVDLGPDLEICTGNLLQLNAGQGYASYLWNDGSVDSMLTVNLPGQYYVTVIDACGQTFSDTVLITAAAPVPFDLGADRTKCNSDTLQLNAPPGFLNYSWGPNYNINNLNSQQVIVNPSVDTIYYARAENSTGCFGFDTVRIRINSSPPIQMGPDTRFCMGDSAVLDAGPGFQQYLWSNNSTGRTNTVYNAGTYSVIATALNGCRSYDTLQILQVWPKPVLQLDKNHSICAGETRILTPGIFSAYQWQNGSNQPTFSVSGTGTFHVTVTDNNNCRASDTVRITQLLPSPSSFLPRDTAICNYGTLQLNSLQTFTSYWWNTNARNSSITISQPGLYWLEVKDANQCTGRDSIRVVVKDCLKGLYVPTGFTPDNNGRNDFLLPFLGGMIRQYEFTIFNRWGEILFSTREYGKGWDGKYKGVLQDGNVYVWVCRYQLDGEPAKQEQGTFVLIR